jgi:peptidoglycan/LPS O-acetylase OafA/YrhL
MLPSAPNLLKQALFLDLNTQFINGSFWTLAVEARWYVILPLALLLWSRNVRLFWFAFATVVVAGRFTMASSLDMLMLPGFLLGIAAAQVAVDGRRVRLWAFAGLAATIALALPISLSQVPGVWPIVGTNAIATIDRASLLWEVAAFCFILLAVSSRRLRAMLGLGPIAFIGAASYSIYLVHQPATMLAAGAVRSGVSQPELFAVCLAVSLAGGIAFWAVFERPIVHGQARSQLVRYLTAVFDRAAAQLQSATAFRLHR